MVVWCVCVHWNWSYRVICRYKYSVRIVHSFIHSGFRRDCECKEWRMTLERSTRSEMAKRQRDGREGEKFHAPYAYITCDRLFTPFHRLVNRVIFIYFDRSRGDRLFAKMRIKYDDNAVYLATQYYNYVIYFFFFALKCKVIIVQCSRVNYAFGDASTRNVSDWRCPIPMQCQCHCNGMQAYAWTWTGHSARWDRVTGTDSRASHLRQLWAQCSRPARANFIYIFFHWLLCNR